MNSWITRKIFRDSFCGDIFDTQPASTHFQFIKLKRTQISGEHNGTARSKKTTHQAQKLSVITLDIPGALAHGFRVGERGRVKEHQIVATGFLFGSLLNPGKNVRADKPMLTAHETRIFHVALRPIKIGLAHVNRGG